MKKSLIYAFINLGCQIISADETTIAYIKNTTNKSLNIEIRYDQVCIDPQTGNANIVTRTNPRVYILDKNAEQSFTFEPLSSRIADNCNKKIECFIFVNEKIVAKDYLQPGRYEIKENNGQFSLDKIY